METTKFKRESRAFLNDCYEDTSYVQWSVEGLGKEFNYPWNEFYISDGSTTLSFSREDSLRNLVKEIESYLEAAKECEEQHETKETKLSE